MTGNEKEQIRALFAYVIRMLKAEAEMSAKISAELAAVLSTVKALDPTFVEVLEDQRAKVDQTGEPIIRADLAKYDEMIRQVESGEIL